MTRPFRSSATLPLIVCLTLCFSFACADEPAEVELEADAPAGAGTEPDVAPTSTPAERPGAGTEVAEAWISPLDAADEVDSVAIWSDADRDAQIIATAKETHQLIVYDAATGEEMRRVGEEGDALGRYRHPNGIAIVDDLVFVVERDGHRVQVLHLPTFVPLGAVGAKTLVRPYGLAVIRGREPGRYELYVTDSYETPEGETPADEALGERVKHFRVARNDSAGIESELVRSFGEVEGPGVLRVVESIVADRTGGRLLIAEEQTGDWSAKVYDLAGTFTGRVVGRGDLGDEAEGIALYPCGDGGWWILTDQREERTVFHLYDRRTFERVGAFSGALVANTDGVALARSLGTRFPEGAFVAVHDDQGVVAFDWRDISSALGLEACDEPPPAS